MVWSLALLLGARVEGLWQSLEPGLDLAAFPESDTERPQIHILRADPARFELRLLNASRSAEGVPRTARDWARTYGLIAAINASMYQEDHRTSVSLMTTRGHTNNPRLSRDQAVLAFDRLDPSVPPVQILDRGCQDFETLRAHYGTLVQSIRMVSCDRANVWSPQPERASVAAIGIDRQGRVLFIHSRTPQTTHDLINRLLALPIDLKNAMYAEGGAQAQLYVNGGGRELELIGASELIGAENLTPAWPLPNVIGLTHRTAAQ